MLRSKSHFWSERAASRDLSEASSWEVEESSAGPLSFIPRPGGCVIFFAQHTLTIEPSARVADVFLLRVGDVSNEVSVELVTLDGTALAGESYAAIKQRVTFPKGASSVNFKVDILASPCNLRGFFVVHVEALSGATMGSSSFCRIRLLPEGVWPPGAPDEVLNISSQDCSLE